MLSKESFKKQAERHPNLLSLQGLHFQPEDFDTATDEEKQSLVIMRESVGFWKDGMRRLVKNKITMISLAVIALILVFAFIMPSLYPYSYEEQLRGRENLSMMETIPQKALKLAEQKGLSTFPHLLGTDSLGRDYMVRLMMGSRVSLLVGIVASAIILLIGSLYGAVSGYFGGKIDLLMMRVVDMIYTVPDMLIIILLSVTLKVPLTLLADSSPAFRWINTVGVGLISIFITFALLYWVGMARMVRSQVLTLKEQEYVTASRALGASSFWIIRKHLLTNCIGTLIIITTLQIPSSIFTESFLSFLGLGVAAPMPSLGSMASTALSGIYSYPHRLLAPSLMISMIILAFNLLGDGLRDAFDPKMKD